MPNPPGQKLLLALQAGGALMRPAEEDVRMTMKSVSMPAADRRMHVLLVEPLRGEHSSALATHGSRLVSACAA